MLPISGSLWKAADKKGKTRMNAIVAVDKKWAIGKNGGLLVQIPADQRFFRSHTVHKVVIMGRKTLESLPGGVPFIDRTCIVLTRKPDYRVNGATVVHSVEEALEAIKEYSTEDVYIMGGEQIYRAFLPYCDIAYVTKIDYTYEADTYFPNLDEMSEWNLTEVSEEQTYYDLVYEFCKYEK